MDEFQEKVKGMGGKHLFLKFDLILYCFYKLQDAFYRFYKFKIIFEI